MKARGMTLTIILALGFTFIEPLVAGDETAAMDKPSISATQRVKVVTVVEAVDYEAKTVTLKGPEGSTRTITAKNTPNLEQVEVGDQVNVEYEQHLSIEVFANDGSAPGRGMMTSSKVNSPDEAPGGMETSTTITMATVEEIDLETNTFKLKMPEGEIREFEAVDPENLKRAAVGDLVVTTFTEAVAIYLVEVPVE